MNNNRRFDVQRQCGGGFQRFHPAAPVMRCID
jgi:hypothetical protein